MGAHRLGTGLRLSEQLGLEWKNVDFLTSFILVPRSKHGKSQRVPMSPQVVELLKGLPSYGKSPWVFPATRSEGPMGRHGGIRRAFSNAIEKARIVDLTWHDLRHDFASRLVMAGVDLPTVQELLGHKTLAMTLR